ncbi:MAG: hypothetical protein WBQ60_11950 [Asticcacaulis sp.]
MTHDALKSILIETLPPAPQAQDMRFVVSVMEKIERRRFLRNLTQFTAIMAGITALLFLIMPYLTPALFEVGRSIWPVLALAGFALLSLIGFEQTRRLFRDIILRF